MHVMMILHKSVYILTNNKYIDLLFFSISRAIKTNQDLLPETPWRNVFYDDFWGTLLTHSGSHKSYRPLCTLSFRLNYALAGLEPWGYHLVNVCLHGIVTGLFTTMCRPLLGGGPWSLVAGLLFAAHPVHTEAVAGVVGRADVGAGLFFLLSLLCYSHHCALRWRGPRSGRAWLWLLGSVGAAAGAMLWKEQGVTVLGVSAVYDLFIFHRFQLPQLYALLGKVGFWTPGLRCCSFFMIISQLQEILSTLSLLAGSGVGLLAARVYWMGNKPPNFSNSDNPAADSPHLLTRTLTFLHLPAANFWLLLCPDRLSFDWSMDALPLLRTFADWRNFQSLAFYAGLLFLVWYVHHNAPWDSLPPTGNLLMFFLALLTLPFLPATNLLFYVGFVVAERVLYIPSMGFCMLVTVGLRSLYVAVRSRRHRTLLLCSTVGLVLLYGAKTALRNRDWQSEETLYRSGIRVNPAKGTAAE
uniref:DUF1736 domain-containing protein n=1 Tax=Denticeps clupeoides TaxID=299321 RepID=A0AAY4EGC0_9TELE